MKKVWALIGIDGEVYGTADTKEILESYMENDFLSLGETIEEIDYNDDPITERGLALQEQLRTLLVDVRKIHVNRQKGFFAMHIDDRLQLLVDFIEEGRNSKPHSFNDSNRAPESKQPQIDLDKELAQESYD